MIMNTHDDDDIGNEKESTHTHTHTRCTCSSSSGNHHVVTRREVVGGWGCNNYLQEGGETDGLADPPDRQGTHGRTAGVSWAVHQFDGLQEVGQLIGAARASDGVGCYSPKTIPYPLPTHPKKMAWWWLRGRAV